MTSPAFPSQVYLTSNHPGQGQLLNPVPILTSVGQGQSNGAMNQRIVAVGGNQPPYEVYPVKVEPVESETEAKTDGSGGNTSFNSTSASELENDGNEDNGRGHQLTRPEQIGIKQEYCTGNYSDWFVKISSPDLRDVWNLKAVLRTP